MREAGDVVAERRGLRRMHARPGLLPSCASQNPRDLSLGRLSISSQVLDNVCRVRHVTKVGRIATRNRMLGIVLQSQLLSHSLRHIHKDRTTPRPSRKLCNWATPVRGGR